MRPVATLFMCLFAGLASAAEPEPVARRAVVVAIPSPGSSVVPLDRAEEQAGRLADRLTNRAGFERVTTLVGHQITADELVDGLRSAVAGTHDDGVLLICLVARGAGGDFGDPALLTHGATVSDPVGTGLALERFADALRPSTPNQNIVLIMDVAHDDAVGGVALIGPAASDWPGMPDWGLAVTSKAAGEGGAEGILFPLVEAGLSGDADADFDGQVTVSELAKFLDAALDPQAGIPLDRAGAVAANLILSTSGRVKPVDTIGPGTLPEPQPARPFRLKPVAIGLASAGAIAGIISVGMYASKRGECEQQGGRLVCGDDDAYRRYRATQVAMGWAGAGLVAAGLGVQFIPAERGAMVGVTARF